MRLLWCLLRICFVIFIFFNLCLPKFVQSQKGATNPPSPTSKGAGDLFERSYPPPKAGGTTGQ
ncbi:hypothetical protein PanWU01x14_152800 [Parasponia andersonii]|uniref:Transmembrane protein n=1 Tax=Parasponia andersonii TaxID=3476 RepID=A0A2P5CHG3_PARAD|nr:hypothetical protein PanWU01x14_152800 [Parasponia andersonii]